MLDTESISLKHTVLFSCLPYKTIVGTAWGKGAPADCKGFAEGLQLCKHFPREKAKVLIITVGSWEMWFCQPSASLPY